jgi:Uma2 family endonuclease
MSVVMADPPAADSQHESLRDVAERVSRELHGYRVEIIEERLVVSPTPTFKHGGIIRRVSRQLDRQLPENRVPHQVMSVEAAEADNEDYLVPDLMVVPIEIEEEDDWLLSADAVDLVAEVVSKDRSRIDTEVKPRLYASWQIPIFFLVDPRDGSMALYHDPRDGAYQGVHRLRFGDTVELPEPLKGITITTSEFPQYDQ